MKTLRSNEANTIQETLGVLTSFLKEKQKPDKNVAFGQYVGLTVADMLDQEQNFKKLKIVDILNQPFQE